MRPVRMALLMGIFMTAGAVSVFAQPVISAKSGVIAYVEGTVFLANQLVEYSVTKFPEMKENSILRTEDGRAEVLLTPGVLLRLGENSSLKLLTNRLVDTRLELQAGSAVVEADAISKDNNVIIVCGNAAVALGKAGIYRFDAPPASVKVFKGDASVQMPGGTASVNAGRVAMLSGSAASVQRFNTEDTDALDRWSRRRGEYVAVANVSAAKSLIDSGGYAGYQPYLGGGLLGPGYGLNNCLNAWAFNQWYGMYTYMPCQGFLYSPYGFAFWSPFTVMRAYYMPSGFYGGQRGLRTGAAAGISPSGLAGYRGASRSAAGYSGVMSVRGSSGSSLGGNAGGRGMSGGGGFSSSGGVGGSAAGGGGHGGGAGGHGGR
jgi:hypothetical protein